MSNSMDYGAKHPLTEQMVTTLKTVLDQNMTEFHASLLDMDKEDIIAQSAEIAAMQAAYDFMKEDFKYERGDAETLLRMETRLRFIADQWPSNMAELFEMSGQMREAIMDADRDAAEEKPSVRSEKPSILSDLSDKKREAGQRNMAEGKSKGGEAR